MKFGIFLFFATVVIHAQNWQVVDSVFSPSGIGVTSFSCPYFGDLNNDGSTDLALGNSSGTLQFFMNNNLGIPPRYSLDTSLSSSIYASGYAGTNSDYPVLIDMDGDTDLDLIISGYNGLLFYKNIGSAETAVWDTADTLLFMNVNNLIGTDAKPALADLDSDGDYDLIIGTGESLFGGPEPGILLGFRNTGNDSAAVFQLDNTLTAGLPDVGLNAYPAFADLDADNDLDLLIGRDLQTFRYYQNAGDSLSPAWSINNTVFSGVKNTTYWKNPALADLDYDNDYDLVYGNTDGRLYFYENTGSPAVPHYQYNGDYFSIIKIDGLASTVSLRDFDGDGDNDMLSGNWLGKFQYFENIGTASSVEFKKTTAPFTNISIGSSYSTPRFIDIDDDGDFDIVSGALNGKIYCYINNGSSFNLNSNLFSNIDLFGSSIPAFTDIDDDGDMDLLVGSDDAGSTSFYTNDGSNNFTLDNSFISGISFHSYSYPSFSDFDNDGDFDLLIGRSSGKIDLYENTGTPSSPAWQFNADLFNGVEVKQNAFTDFADMDGDGKKDLIVGEYDGNFTYFKNLLNITAVEFTNSQVINGYSLFQNYPNPFNPTTTIKYSIPTVGNENFRSLQLKVYNVLGREVAELVNKQQKSGNYEVEFDASSVSGGLSSGVYFYRLIAPGISLSKKFILLK